MNKKTVVIHQPDFAPYLGFFHRFLHADLYVALDHVQFVSHSSKSWTHRDKIKTQQGEKWLTLSVKKASRETPINQIALSETTDWVMDNLNLLAQNYRKTAHFEAIMPSIEDLYRTAPPLMSDFNLRSINVISQMLDVELPSVRSSTLDPQGSKNELLIDLLQKVGATHYLSGMGAKNYMRPELFSEAGIHVVWQDFKHPTYPQPFGDFLPYLSSLDVLFNCGIEGARQALRSAK